MEDKFIPLSVPSIMGNEWKYIKECLDTEWVSTAGGYVDKFEEAIKEFTGAKYAIACTNGTSALHISLKVAGVKAGEEIIVPTLTFIATINAVAYLNAEPIFMDCDNHFNIDPEKTIGFIKNETYLKNECSYNKKTNRKIAAIMPVHVFGNAANYEELISICNERNIKVIEDSTESLGTKYISGKLQNKHTGTIGDLGCFSFNGNKIITCGGGGMVVTNNDEYASKVKYLTTQAKDDEVYYIHNEIGYNYRLTNIQAALGVAQMEQLNNYIRIKQNNFKLYKQAIDSIEGLEMIEGPEYADNNYWMYALYLDNEYPLNRDELLKVFKENKIQTRPIWYLNHNQKPFANKQNYMIERANILWNNVLNIPCSVSLKEEEIDRITNILKSSIYNNLSKV